MGTFKTQLLWDSIRKGDLSATSSLLQNGTINPEERDEKGKTFLMLAAECGELNIVRELLEHVDTNAVDNDNWSALLMAAKEGHLEIVIELLDRGADIEHKDMAGWTALMWACYKGHDEVVAELLEKNANPNVKAEYNMTCLAWAAGRGHTEIVKMLLEHDAKVNVTDKYGTTPLIWACRRGYLEIVEALIDARADVNVTGTNSWTALLVATKGGFTEVVGQLLEADPNVNVVDKDGFSALTIAAKEGFIEIAHDLLAKGAYVNVDDRAGDTILIHAVKGGHEEIVRALLNKYADVNVQGAEGKTALYWAVEKGHTEICRLLLDNEPELELCTKDEDTPLMRAVRNRNENCVRLLLDKGAKVSAVDKRGDTALHIALRARSKRITELLLRNPRNSRLLYQSNKSGETPYQIDNYHQKGILTQIFGHRNLNANDGENLLGYDIYSSALADILSDPSLNTPITIGLYAKWGSGKSFLLSKLISEMKTFTKESEEEHFNFSWTLFFFLFIINNIIGFVIAITTKQWEAGLGLGLGLFILEYGFLSLIKMLTEKFQWRYAVGISLGLGRRLLMFSLLFKVLFCNPKSTRSGYLSDVPSVKFLFSESTRLVSVGGEKALAAMVATLGSVLEKEYGMMVARLFRVYKPNMRASGHMMGRFKTLCCIPYFLIVILIMLCIGVGVVLLVIYGISTNTPVNIAMITFAVIVALAVISNFYVWWQSLKAIMFSQEKRILKAADNIDYIKMDGLMQKLKYEVDLMSSMVSCMDKFTETQTRLVVIVDGLDSCEQDKVLQVFDIIKALFSDESSPFITILAVDPHIIIRGIESNIRGTIQDSNVNGFDYLRNAVHLPFYLQSQGMKIQKQELARTSTDDSPTRSKNVQRQDSVWSSYSHLEPKSRKKIKSARRQESYQPSISSSTDIYSVTKSDYFSEVNPRSVRRLMNIVAVTGRLLRAYNIDFSWHRLAAWINLLEQWPYRVSWLILHFEENEMLDDSVTLAQIYEKVLAKIPSSKDIDPLLEIDRNVRKLEAFLSSRSSNSPVLNVGDLKKFLPCTINLDPYLRKLIREMQKNQEPFLMNSMFPMGPNAAPGPGGAGVIPGPSGNPLMAASPGRVPDIGLVQRRTVASPRGQGFGGLTQSIDRIMAAPPTFPPYMGMPYYMYHPGYGMTYPPAPPVAPVPPTSSEKEGAVHTEVKIEGYERQPLSTMSVEDLCSIVARIKGLNKNLLQQYQASLRDNNICGMVLSNCSLEELKEVTQMKFGDWQLFKSAVLFLRKQEEEMVTEEELEELAVAREGGPDDNEPQEEEEEATEGSMLINKGSDHGSQTNRKKSILVSADRGQGSPGPSGYNQKKSVQIKCAKEEAALKSESYRASKQRELSIPGSSSMDVDPAGLVYGELDQQKPMRRNDSIYKQVEYETGLLNSAMMNFTGVEEGQEEEEEEEDYEGEEEQTLLRSDRIDNTTPPPRQGSCMTPPLQRQNSVAESETSASRVKFMLFEENASNSATVETEPVREDTDPLISSSSSLEHKRGMMGSFARTLSSSIEKLSKVIHHPLHHHSSDFSSSDQGHQGQGLGSDLESMQASHSLHSMGFSSPAELSVSSTSVNTGHNIKVRALTHMGSSSQSDAVDIVNETQLNAFKSPRKDHSLKQDIQKYVDSTADTSQPFLTRGAVSTPSLADRGPLVHRDALSFDDDHESKV